jgi:MoaA/NifB/PqqE/SkfB family radical SAM enzyme
MHLNIELTNRCNQSCFYCSNPASNTAEIDAGEWLSIIKSREATSVHLTGGEPLIYSGLEWLLIELHKINIKTSILSNGGSPKTVSANREKFEKLSVAQISLDSAEAYHHDMRRASDGAHQRAVETLMLFKEMSVPIEISMVVDRQTAYQVLPMINYCREIDAKLVLRPLAKLGRSTEYFKINNSLYSLIEENQDIIVPDQFGYGAPSIGCVVSEQLTLGATG